MSSGQSFRGGNIVALGSVKRCSMGSVSCVGGSLSSRRRFDGGAMTATGIATSVPTGLLCSGGDAMSWLLCYRNR